MRSPAPVQNEKQRLEALARYAVMDTPPEAGFDDLVQLAAHICGAPIALISLLDRKRQWFKARVGLETCETPREISFCGHAIHEPDLFIVPDAAADERFHDNPLVAGEPHIRFYAGSPLRTADGQVLGMLCVVDHEPRELTKAQLEALRALGRQVMAQLELRRQSRELIQSEARYRALVEQAADAIFIVGPERRFLEANRRTCELFGYERDELVGLSITEVVAKHELAPQAESFGRVLHGERVQAERWFRRKDGFLFLGEVVAARTESGLVLTIVRDITQRKRTEQALRESESRLREATKAANVGLWDWNLLDNDVWYSPEWKHQIGHEEDEISNGLEEWRSRVHPEDLEQVEARVKAYLEKPWHPYQNEFRFRHKDGSYRWILAQGSLISDGQGRPVRMLGSHLDITELRELEGQLRQSQKLEAIGQLAGGVAHDFNNIVAAMMMQAELVQMTGGLDGEVRDGLEQIRAGAERAATLTRQLLLFSRKQRMEPRELDLNEVVTGLAKMLHRIIGEDVRLQLNLHPRPLRTRADAGMLDQVLMNLVVNARDAMPGGGRINIETTERDLVEARAGTDPAASMVRRVCLRVTDTGTGITPENLPHIFEPFFTTKEPGKGTGLGLAIVFGIVEQHGGRVTVSSEVGGGTTFEICLPASKATEAAEETVGKAAPCGGTETILLVEDDATVRFLTRVVLERRGYQVIEAAHGADALRMWKRHRKTIQLLLTDMVMPGGVSGRDLAAKLRASRPGLPVIFTSGYSEEIAGRGLVLETGQEFIQKPASPQQLLETVRRLLDGCLTTEDSQTRKAEGGRRK